MAAAYTKNFNTDELNIFVHTGANAEKQSNSVVQKV